MKRKQKASDPSSARLSHRSINSNLRLLPESAMVHVMVFQFHRLSTIALLAVLSVLLTACGGAKVKTKTAMPDPLADVEAKALFDQAVVLERQGDPIRAEQYYAAAIDRGYPTKEAVPAIVRVCVSSSRLRSALRYALPYLERNPKEWALRYLVASIEHGLDMHEEAERSVSQVIRDKPDFADGYFLLAVVIDDGLKAMKVAAQRERDVQANRYYRKYLELAPTGKHAQEAQQRLSVLERELASQLEATPQLKTTPQREVPGTKADASTRSVGADAAAK